MYRLGNGRALGGTLGIIYDSDDDYHQPYTVAFRLHLRQWTSENTYVEISPGMTLSTVGSRPTGRPSLNVDHPQFVATIAVGLGGCLALVAHYENLQFIRQSDFYHPDSRTCHTGYLYFGVRLGSTPGIVLAPVTFLLSGYLEVMRGLSGMD
jgi:hypothetical protein